MEHAAKIVGIICLIMVVPWILQLMCCNRYRLSQLENPFPRQDQIENIRFRSSASKTEWEADVPPERFGMLASLFDSAQKDPSPLPWEIVGDLDVKLKSGKVIHICIFNISPPPAGFMIDKQCYRGGTMEQFSRFFDRKGFQQSSAGGVGNRTGPEK